MQEYLRIPFVRPFVLDATAPPLRQPVKETIRKELKLVLYLGLLRHLALENIVMLRRLQ